MKSKAFLKVLMLKDMLICHHMIISIMFIKYNASVPAVHLQESYNKSELASLHVETKNHNILLYFVGV